MVKILIPSSLSFGHVIHVTFNVADTEVNAFDVCVSVGYVVFNRRYAGFNVGY